MHIHFIGIGGIGMSALARYFLAKGHSVSGSDATRSEITDSLKNEGVKIFIGHRARNIVEGKDLVVYSAAISPANSELRRAKKLGTKTQSYAQALGELTKQHFTLAVCGSHGKSTTTALLALILIKAGFDPTVIVGTKLKEFGSSNFRAGQGKHLIIEADEYNRSFHNYYPQIAVVTNIDAEHLDTYGDLNGVVAGFHRFFKNVPSSGHIIANWQDKNIHKALQVISANKTYFNRGKFQLHRLQIPGMHNQLNAEAAWRTAKVLGIKRAVAEAAFAAYQGAWRRLERIKPKNKFWRRFIVFSDYAHHPTEIKATLQALYQKYRKRKIICVFQPHQQDRLTRLFQEFPTAFGNVNELILLPAYIVKGRDNYLPNKKTSKELAKAIQQSGYNPPEKVSYFGQVERAFLYLEKAEISSQTVIVFMGAGDVDSAVKNRLG